MNKVTSTRPTITDHLTGQEAALFVAATTTTYVDVLWSPLPEERSIACLISPSQISHLNNYLT